LDDDSSTLPFIFGATTPLDWNALVPRITREPFRPDGNLNVREIPISMQLPDWNHWLPQVHPMDAWGPAFEKHEFADYRSTLRNLLASPNLSASISSGRI